MEVQWQGKDCGLSRMSIEGDVSGKIVRLFQTCPSCRGWGYWLLHWIRRDGSESKRRKRYRCWRCKGTGAVKADTTEWQPDPDIPF